MYAIYVKGKKNKGYWTGCITSLKESMLEKDVILYDNEIEVKNIIKDLKKVNTSTKFEPKLLNVLNMTIDLDDENIVVWSYEDKSYIYEKHTKENGRVFSCYCNKKQYDTATSHSAKTGYPYVSKKLVRSIPISAKDVVREVESILIMVKTNPKENSISNCERLNLGIKAAKYLIYETTFEMNQFLATASKIYLPEYISKKEKEYKGAINKYKLIIKDCRKSILEYNDFITTFKIQNLRKKELKALTIANLEGKCSKCNAKVNHHYNTMYCGSCGAKIDWDMLYKKNQKK